MSKVLQRGKLRYILNWDTMEHVEVGEIRKELTETFRVIIVFDFSEEQFKRLGKILKRDYSMLLPGFDTDYGYYKRYGFLPFFITMRVPDHRRQDIAELAAEKGMDTYDEFTFLLRNHGRSLDNWYIEEIPIEPSCYDELPDDTEFLINKD